MAETSINQKDLVALVEKVNKSTIPEGLKETVMIRMEQLQKLIDSPSFLPEYDRMAKYVEWIVRVPWEATTNDNLDLENAKRVLDSHHYGLGEIKDRILEYLSVMKLKKEKNEAEDIGRAPILFFVGLVGTGKTTIAVSIAEAMGRKFARIPFGGMGDPLDLRGLSKMHPEAEPGKVIKSLVDAGSRNPVILLDEIDRVTEQGRSSIMGVLVELLDPKQNHAFTDHYIDFPVDLSQCLFIGTANNTNNIAIAQKYVFPEKMRLAGLPNGTLQISDETWPLIVRPLGYDSGIRTLERTIDGVVRKVARMIVEGKIQNIVLTPENIRQLLPQ